MRLDAAAGAEDARFLAGLGAESLGEGGGLRHVPVEIRGEAQHGLAEILIVECPRITVAAADIQGQPHVFAAGEQVAAVVERNVRLALIAAEAVVVVGEAGQHEAFLVDVVVGLGDVVHALSGEFVVLGGAEAVDAEAKVPVFQRVANRAPELDVFVVGVARGVNRSQLDLALPGPLVF